MKKYETDENEKNYKEEMTNPADLIDIDKLENIYKSAKKKQKKSFNDFEETLRKKYGKYF